MNLRIKAGKIFAPAPQAMFDRPKAITLADLLDQAGCGNSPELGEVFTHKRHTLS